ncbi:MAG: type II toxin-antitoxin system HicB family antitoxin [Minisyncoccia bacterium]
MKEVREKIFSVIYEPAEEGGYVASAPSLPGCYSQGETLEETKKNIQEAIGVYLEETNETIDQNSSPFIGTVSVYA